MNDRYTPDDKGVYDKYTVTRTENGATVMDCFVLRIHDPHAREALLVYAQSVVLENPTLARDLVLWLRHYEKENEVKPEETP